MLASCLGGQLAAGRSVKSFKKRIMLKPISDLTAAIRRAQLDHSAEAIVLQLFSQNERNETAHRMADQMDRLVWGNRRFNFR